MRRALFALFLLLSPAAAAPARATTVTALQAVHRDGQTFLTWTAPAGTGWRYRVYSSPTPITASAQLAGATLVGSVGDSTWCDRRFSRLRGTVFGYSIDSLAPALTATRGLFVRTVGASGASCYAVTAQALAGAEDLTIVPGANALAGAVTELLGVPRPVYQRSLTVSGVPCDVYTLWTSPVETPLFAAMGSQYGLAFDCAVVKSTPGGSLMVRPHARGGSFLQVLTGSGEPNEWRLALDDWMVSASEGNSFWFGYHTGFDPFVVTHVAPTTGTVVDYTTRRIVHTLAWARRTLPVDTTRVYAMGGSMGAIGSLVLGHAVPQWIAGIQGIVPKFDFSYDSDPNPANVYNPGQPERAVVDRLWGSLASDLPCSDGQPVYTRQNMGAQLAIHESTSFPPVMAFNGKNDVVVGWGEKIGYYAATQQYRHGGHYFWDQRQHGQGSFVAWLPIQSARYLYRYRTNRSYPAVTNCAADQDPGDGNAADGDSVGTIGGAVEWDSVLVDQPQGWRCTLWTRALTAQWGVFAAPESTTADVTPRRLQSFLVTPGAPYSYTVTRRSDGALVRSGTVIADALGLLTVTGVPIYSGGSVLALADPAALAVPGRGASGALRLTVGGATLAHRRTLSVSWPAAGAAELELLDLSGRRVATLERGPVAAGARAYTLETGALASGVYFVSARQAGARGASKLLVVR